MNCNGFVLRDGHAFILCKLAINSTDRFCSFQKFFGKTILLNLLLKGLGQNGLTPGVFLPAFGVL